MDLLALAVPFFLFAMLFEFAIDRTRKSGLYRANDAINSLSAGILSTTIGYFTKLLPLLAWGFVLENFALIDMPLAWFDASSSGVVLWIVAALAWDFCYYWFHRYSHEISILWAAHAVHHQSEEYNLSTALRQTSTGFLFGWIFYLPLFLIGFPLEILVTVNAVNLIYQFWVHTQVVRRLGILDYVVITPSNHRVHHAQNDRYIDKNYGGMLIIWDRMFGTFADERDDDPVIFGVRKPLANWNPFWANLQVYDYLLFDAARTTLWKDKVGVWLRRTGWRPADVEHRYPKRPADIATFEKFDPPLSGRMRSYVLAQFFVALAGALIIAEMFVSAGPAGVAIPCVMLWLQLYTLGVINEGRAIAARLETLRLLISIPVCTAGLLATSAMESESLWLLSLAYIIVSMAGFLIASRQE